MRKDLETRLAVESFLYHEADLLDRWKLDDWLSLYDQDCRYEVAPTGESNLEELSPDTTLFIIADNRYRLEQRVIRLKKPTAWVESPKSRTRHMVGNVEVLAETDDEIVAQANFIVYRTTRNVTMQFPGHSRYVLAKGDDGYRVRHKRVMLDLDALVPQGRVGILI